MENRRIWIFLGLGLVLGLSFEVMKHGPSTGEEGRLARLARLEAILDEGRPLFIPSGIEASSKPRSVFQRVAGLVGAGVSPASSPDESAKPAAKSVAKVDDAKKKAADKKKKKKDEEKKDAPVALAPKTESDEAPKVSDADDSSDEAMAPIGGFVGGAPTIDPDAIPRTAKEWEAILLVNPTNENAQKFIKYYQTGLIEAEVFYEVIDSLIADQRDKPHELAVMALGSTPSVRSFSYLAAYGTDESTPAKLRAQSRIYMRMYTRLEYLRFLAGAVSVSSNDSRTSGEALSLIQAAAELHLRGTVRTGPSPSNDETPTRTPAAASVRRYFDSFTNVLTAVSQTAPDQNLRLNAGQALSTIRTLLGPPVST